MNYCHRSVLRHANSTVITITNLGTLPVFNAGLQLFQKVKVQGVHLSDVEEYLLPPTLGENGSSRQLGRPDGSMDHLRGEEERWEELEPETHIAQN